jgi:uncharacterized coiled-coil protein SlyX
MDRTAAEKRIEALEAKVEELEDAIDAMKNKATALLIKALAFIALVAMAGKTETIQTVLKVLLK